VENSKEMIIVVCCHSNSLQYTPMNLKETPGARCLASLHYECQEFRPKGESNSSFLVFHPSSGEDTVNTVWSHLKAGVNIKAVFWLCTTFLTQISRSRFKQSRMSPLIPHIYVLGRFVNFLVIFLICLEINSFSERISKIYGNRKF